MPTDEAIARRFLVDLGWTYMTYNREFLNQETHKLTALLERIRTEAQREMSGRAERLEVDNRYIWTKEQISMRGYALLQITDPVDNRIIQSLQMREDFIDEILSNRIHYDQTQE